MQLVLLVLIALAPIIFILFYFYLRDKYDKEPLRNLIITFILGALTTAPVLWISDNLSELTHTSLESKFPQLLIYAFLVVAITEESMKYLVLRLFCYNQKEFDEPYDGIMYGVAAAMGFAAIENVIYVMNGGEKTGLEVGLLRMFTAVPAHAVFGAVMGYFVGKAKFISQERDATITHIIGLLFAVFLHGVYDFFIFYDAETFGVLSLLLLVIGVFYSNKAIKMQVALSPHKEKSEIVQIEKEE
jgi:RsiW-degrading membrane proteinase PrsW (M82 family)